MENIIPQNKLVKDSEGNKENGYPVTGSQQNKNKLSQGTQQSPQESPERRSLARNH
jgi:hypothetical protein